MGMVIMAMVMEKRINKFCLAYVVAMFFYWFSSSTPVNAREWQFSPSFGIEETYTDNIGLTIENTESSLVSQAIIGLDVQYQSPSAIFSLTGESSNVFYSHDNELNNDYLALQATGGYSLWTSGPELFVNFNVGNVNRSNASNGLADLVSGDTIQTETHSTGLIYNVDNSTFSLLSSLSYSVNRSEDEIGDNNSVSAILNTRNNSNARVVFWQLNSSFSSRRQDFSGQTRKAEQYRVEATVGMLSSLNFNPFVRFYDEDFSGDLSTQTRPTTASWGPGVLWQVSDHLIVDLSYNYVTNDNTTSDDYIATTIQWVPSIRTSLNVGYSQRFFGESYNLNIQHKSRRLTNTVTYDETLTAFDRNNYEQIDIGIFWCPPDTVIQSITQCFAQSEQPPDGDYQLASFFSLEPVENREFSLNKQFLWSSNLQLARTSFAISASASRREGIESTVVNDNISANFTIVRKISGKSQLTFLSKYDYFIFDKNNPEGSRQEDRYRTISASYTKDLASSLSAHFTLQHVNRDSNIDTYSYDEVRAIINITKDF